MESAGSHRQVRKQFRLKARFMALADNWLQITVEENAAARWCEGLAIAVVEGQDFIAPRLKHNTAARRRPVERLIGLDKAESDVSLKPLVQRIEANASQDLPILVDVDQVLQIAADALLSKHGKVGREHRNCWRIDVD